MDLSASLHLLIERQRKVTISSLLRIILCVIVRKAFISDSASLSFRSATDAFSLAD
jgi:hypothetical protein